MNIEIIKEDKKRGRIICKIDGRVYNLPKGLVEKLLKLKEVKNVLA